MVMRQHRADAEIHTFSFCSPGFSEDESRWSSNDRSGGRKPSIIEYSCNRQNCWIFQNPLSTAQDEPFGGTSVIAQYAVFRAAKENGVP